MKSIKIIISAILLNYFALSVSNSEVINQIEIEGNKRITDEIILMFSEIDIGQDITNLNDYVRLKIDENNI